MRIIVTARQTLTPGHEALLNRLVGILGVISSNPSNPKFDQYIFESISALMRRVSRSWSGLVEIVLTTTFRFIVSSSRQTLATFEQVLFGPFTIILQNDIDRKCSFHRFQQQLRA